MNPLDRARICCQVTEIGRVRLGEQDQHTVRLQARRASTSKTLCDGVTGELTITGSDAEVMQQFELGAEICLGVSPPDLVTVWDEQIATRGAREIRLLLPADATQAEIVSAVAGLSRVDGSGTRGEGQAGQAAR